MRNLNILKKGDEESEPDSDDKDDNEMQERKAQFQKWLQKLFKPSHQRIFGGSLLSFN